METTSLTEAQVTSDMANATLTGKQRYRVNFLGQVILQVEEIKTVVQMEMSIGGPIGVDRSIVKWKDAKIQDITNPQVQEIE